MTTAHILGFPRVEGAKRELNLHKNVIGVRNYLNKFIRLLKRA